MQHELEGWRSVHGRGADGSIESDERVTAASPVVGRSEAGARLLGERCWHEVASAIRGGLLARRPGGALTLSQTGAGRPELRAAVHGFAPRLGSRPDDRIQRRLHVAVSRRYFRSLIDEARV
jgi:hypothetical protein